MHRRCLQPAQRISQQTQTYWRPCQQHSRSLTTAASAESSKPRPDPFAILAPQLTDLRASLLSMLGSGHPAVTEITKYYFLHPSKQIRPVIVLLMAQATNGLGGNWNRKLWESGCEGAGGTAEELDRPLTRPDVLNDWNPNMPRDTASFDVMFKLRPTRTHRHSRPMTSPPPSSNVQPKLSGVVLPTQRRLAQIVEMLHTASLLHDDVIDESALRRGAPSAPAAFGNKLSVLGGNFVLGRAEPRRGRDPATAGDQARDSDELTRDVLKSSAASRGGHTNRDAWNIYLQKTYLKTASLMAKGARSSVVLGGCKEGEVWKEIAYAYGRNLGIAFQLVDDVLDYEYASATLGKPGGADLQLGLATGPALYAWEEHPEIGELIQRKFEHPGDVELARDYVLRSSGVQRTRALAQAYADKAKEVLQQLPDSEAKACLEVLTERVIGRKS
ncbi:hypothetical protein NLJ89_g1933 [Agrocybe chaxingu]|uniref:(2E,6E)-farnesyl diphosphate synthase n=1 Tax=Agrocybe chaxingu TaxID=84603 RepID=A0A9W8MZ31_9AGAR|nr:hypothetical protein NLJ89_g1933 [Agrocybe chaxingu]